MPDLSETGRTPGCPQEFAAEPRRIRVVVEERDTLVIVRCPAIQEEFAEIIFSVSSRSILVCGIPQGQSSQHGPAEPGCFIEVTDLPAGIDSTLTTAEFQGEQIIITIPKMVKVGVMDASN